jgi:outer membrane receptor for ferrienterochelin and colicin
MNNRYLFLCLLFIGQLCFGQVTMSGYVADAATGERLIGANVFDMVNKKGVSSNKYGFYSLSLQAGKQQISISYIGYESKTFYISVARDSTVQILLKSIATNLSTVEIKASNTERLRQTIGLVSLPIAQLKAVPTLFGESDIIKALALTPGVSVGTENTTGIMVRGGTPDQNLILLDEAPVYNVSHLFGFVSTFNPDAIHKVDLYKGGFPARFGGRLSSVIDITMKEGNKQEAHGDAGIGLLSSRFLYESPLSVKLAGKSSFMVSGRASYIGLGSYFISD